MSFDDDLRLGSPPSELPFPLPEAAFPAAPYLAKCQFQTNLDATHFWDTLVPRRGDRTPILDIGDVPVLRLRHHAKRPHEELCRSANPAVLLWHLWSEVKDSPKKISTTLVIRDPHGDGRKRRAAVLDEFADSARRFGFEVIGLEGPFAAED